MTEAAPARDKFIVSYFRDYAASTKIEQAKSLNELAEQIRRARSPVKTDLPWLKLARFGNSKTAEGSLRNNTNVIGCTGLEADYDGEQIGFDYGVQIAEKIPLRCIIYTSPSHTPDKPRWRVLAPYTEEINKDARSYMLDRLNGAFGGIFAPESWTISQSYYYGATGTGEHHRVEIVDGEFIDQLHDLDLIAIGKPDNGNKGQRVYSGCKEECEPLTRGPVLQSAIKTITKAVERVRDCEQSDQAKHFVLRNAALLCGGVIHNTELSEAEAVKQLIEALPDSVKDWNNAKRTAEWGIKHGKRHPIVSRPDPIKSNGLDPAPGNNRPRPKPLGDAAYHGLAGDFVRIVGDESEADPAALLLHCLTYIGNAIGDAVYYRVEDTLHRPTLFLTLVGSSSVGRKGTARNRTDRLIHKAIPEWWEKCIASGLSTGEGLIAHVRDAEYTTNKKGEREIVDAGAEEKRALIIEEEFGRTLDVMARPGNTLPAVVKQAWDGSRLSIITRNQPLKATGATISIIGHITEKELVEKLTETTAAGGFGNRFLWPIVNRSKCLPFGGRDCGAAITQLAEMIGDAIRDAPHGEMTWDAAAHEKWPDIYREMTEEHPGLAGALIGRSAPQIIRLALIYAVLDRQHQIGLAHLDAAYEIVCYSNSCVRHIFGDATGNSVADTIIRQLRTGTNGMTKTEINALFGRHQSAAALDAALTLLITESRVRYETIASSGRSTTRYFATLTH